MTGVAASSSTEGSAGGLGVGRMTLTTDVGFETEDLWGAAGWGELCGCSGWVSVSGSAAAAARRKSEAVAFWVGFGSSSFGCGLCWGGVGVDADEQGQVGVVDGLAVLVVGFCFWLGGWWGGLFLWVLLGGDLGGGRGGGLVEDGGRVGVEPGGRE